VRRPSFQIEAVLATIAAVALLAAVVCWVVAASQDNDQLGNRGTGLLLLGLALGGASFAVRARSDISVWRIPPGPLGRRAVLAVMVVLLLALGLGGLFALATGDA